jgi:hypothetical protein
MVSALSAQGSCPYARFVCRRRSFLCLISLQRRHSLLTTRHSPLSFSRIMFPSNPFRSNTYKTFCKCSFQKTYSKAKSFSSNTYKKNRGWGSDSLSRCFINIRVRCGPVDAPLEPRCFPTGISFYVFFLHTVTKLLPLQRGGVHPLPSLRLVLSRNPFSVPRCLCGFPAQPKLMQEILCSPFQLCAWPRGLAHRRFSWNAQS